jgi:predicted phosphodiesterase
MTVSIIGDVHGHIDSYKQVANGCEHSIQIGDMGFNYLGLNELDHNKHKFFGGNHDNYGDYHKCKYSLGDYGLDELGGLEFFFVRGAFSVDIMYRLEENMNNKKSWWSQEELLYDQMRMCEEEYRKVKPKVMLTHTAPREAIKNMFSNSLLMRLGLGSDFVSQTSSFLQSLFEIHQPDTWVFGHFHQNITESINGTKFVCLPELGYIDL